MVWPGRPWHANQCYATKGSTRDKEKTVTNPPRPPLWHVTRHVNNHALLAPRDKQHSGRHLGTIEPRTDTFELPQAPSSHCGHPPTHHLGTGLGIRVLVDSPRRHRDATLGNRRISASAASSLAHSSHVYSIALASKFPFWLFSLVFSYGAVHRAWEHSFRSTSVPCRHTIDSYSKLYRRLAS